jgi:hypothetical protein
MTRWRMASLSGPLSREVRHAGCNYREHTGGGAQCSCVHILPLDYNRSNREDVNIVLEVRDNEHSLIMCPTDRGNDPTVDSNETEIIDREPFYRDGNGPLHDNQ